MRSYRPTYFSPTNQCWTTVPSLLHFHRAMALEFDAPSAYHLGRFRLAMPTERGLVTGCLDCWVEQAGEEWLEMFANDNQSAWCEAMDMHAMAARRWCIAKRFTHRIIPRRSLMDRTLLRENQRRVVGYYNETFVSRSTELEECLGELLNRLIATGPISLSELLASCRHDIPSQLANLAVCELLRSGRVDGDLANVLYGGRSRLSIANSQK